MSWARAWSGSPCAAAGGALLFACALPPLHAEADSGPAASIRDNSFLLEEAYNQEDRVVQHISTWMAGVPRGGWIYTFTDEWPLGGPRDQLSVTLPVLAPEDGASGLAQSLVWSAAPAFNLLLEGTYSRLERAECPCLDGREEVLLLAPGIRWAHTARSGLQIVPGISAPFGLGPSRGDRYVLLYLSLEHGF